MAPPPSVSCFSYLARVRTLYVEHDPKINYGVDGVLRTDQALAGDGPLVAGSCALWAIRQLSRAIS
jgi:hypothetical protein